MHCAFPSSPFLLCFSTTRSPSAPTPPLRRNGEGQDGGAGTRKEGDGGGKRKEGPTRVVITVGAADGMDPGRLDPIHPPARRLDELAELGLVADGAARLSEWETEPHPRPGECVLLATHVDHGFLLPSHPFFRGFLNFFGAQLHHFSPNSIIYLTALCPCAKISLAVDRTGVSSNSFSPSVPSRSKRPTRMTRKHTLSKCAVVWVSRRGRGAPFLP